MNDDDSDPPEAEEADFTEAELALADAAWDVLPALRARAEEYRRSLVHYLGLKPRESEDT